MSKPWLALAAAAALLVACGGDDDASPTASVAPSGAPSTSVIVPTGSPVQTPAGGLVTDLATSQPLMVAYGAGEGDLPSDQPGLAVADFNDDGLPDIAVGARFTDGPNGADSGAIYLIYGRAQLPAVVDFAAAEYDAVIYGPGPGASLGFSAAAGDFNGDGVADLVAGAPFFPADSKPGTAYVLYGPLAPGTTDLGDPGAADVALTGVTASGFFGDSLAAGDVNDDGTDDLLVGSTFAGRGDAGGLQPGALFAYFGGDWPATLGPGDADVRLYGADQFDELGDFVVAGDINADGIDDVIATAEAADGPGNSRELAAEVDVLFGGEDLGGDYLVGDNVDLTVYGAVATDTLGFSLAAGDLNADGNGDLAMSAHLAGANGSRTGAVYVLYGRDDLPGEIDLASPPDYVATLAGASPADLLATSMTVADPYGDGTNDLVLGGSFVDVQQRVDAGVVYILDAAQLSGTSAVTGPALRRAFYGAAASERLGSNVAVADLDGDSKPEVITIAETAQGPDATRPQAGRIYVVAP